MTKKFVDYSLYQKLHVFLGEETVELQNVHQNVTSFFQNRVLSKVLLLQASCISLFKLHDCFNLKTLKSFDPLFLNYLQHWPLKRAEVGWVESLSNLSIPLTLFFWAWPSSASATPNDLLLICLFFGKMRFFFLRLF